MINSLPDCLCFSHTSTFAIYPTRLSLFLSQASLSLSLSVFSFFAECPAQLASTFSLFASGIVPCMSSVAVRRKGFGWEVLFTSPRPPSPLNGDNRAVLYVQMTTHKHTDTHMRTLPGDRSTEGLCDKLTFEGMAILRNRAATASRDCVDDCFGQENVKWA